MVNTRRSESSSLAPENGQRYQTRRSNELARELGSSCDSVNGEQDDEDTGEEDSWSSQDKTNIIHVTHQRSPAAPIATRVRELRSRFVCDEKKFTRLHLKQHRSNRISRRRHVKIYTSHKMRDIIDSDMEDCYSQRLRKNGYTKRESRINRRAALSLRPIMQKSYKDGGDNSAPNCNSEDESNESTRVRRSARTRTSNYRTWIGDDEMHKIGYPTMHQYTDEDSRDVEVQPARKRNRNSKYMYGYEPPERGNDARAESQDKENKEDIVNRNNGRLRRSTTMKEKREHDAEDKEENDDNMGETSKTDVETSVEENLKAPTNKEAAHEGDGDEQPVKEERNGTASSESEPEQQRNGPQTRTGGRKRKLSTSSSEAAVKGYSLRDRRRKPMPIYSDRATRNLNRNISRDALRFNHRRFNRRNVSSDSDSDSSDSDRRHNNKYSKPPKSPHSKNEQLRTGAGVVLPIAPETLDPKINFKSVGGLKEHVQCLKEMVLLPMMYPEVFTQFQIQPSRGVLFHGPPGTGKTLLARALANECSFGSKKVSFFMRKGADLLSKWIGESEKQLRMLFEQAAEKKPSIIFFDELDGLAPVRSSRQDQVHASIVSTLLALMDGLTNRGEIIVIGATNRIEAIDPALRRPGRFDRELFFPLPAQKEREEILRVHLSQWSAPPSDPLITYLSENSAGYCGSDLRALCSEAVIQSFRRTYPQVYTADHRLVLNPVDVKVEKIDFLRAKSVLVPASHRVTDSVGSKLTSIVQPLLTKPLKDIMSLLDNSFPHGVNANLAKVKVSASLRPAQVLLAADSAEHGNSTYLAPALLHHMEHIHSYILDLAALHRDCGRSPEEACIQIFHEAKRNVPSIIYIPNIDTFWELVTSTVIGIFTTQLKQIGPNSPILLLATSDTQYTALPDSLRSIFSMYRNEVYDMQLPDEESRTAFFSPLLLDACIKPPRSERTSVKEFVELPRAPTPPPEPISQDVAKKLYETEEGTLRELRIFLRDICKKLASNKLFFLFTKPVDTEEVPDYPNIITEPMDLETMMTKVDFHRYECAKDFLSDIELICRNALEYNPARTSADKQIRHRACSLRDYAFALIKSEMDSDFEDKCLEIAHRRRQRNACINEYLPPYLNTPEDAPSLQNDDKPDDNVKDCEATDPSPNNGLNHSRVSPSRKRKGSNWQRGCLKKRKKNFNRSTANETPTNNHELTNDKITSEEDSKDAPEDEDMKDKTIAGCENECKDDCGDHTLVSAPTNEKNEVARDMNDLLSPSELLEDPLDFDDIDKALNESTSGTSTVVLISQRKLMDVLKLAVVVTKNKPLTSLLDLHFQMSRIVKKFIKSVDREKLPVELLAEIKRYRRSNQQPSGTHCDETSSNNSHFSDLCPSETCD